jgi:enoyl-CoA hydratase/carnithine racemase
MTQQQRAAAKAAGDPKENPVAYQHILYEVSEKIATITLNRPDRMNAWTPIMERDVRHAMEAAATDDNVRVIVLTGAGRAFCAGADMEALKGLDPDDIKRAQSLPPFDMNRRPDWQSRYGYYPSISKPVIGMLNGATAGIGLVHALYCDLRFAADNTVFTTAFSRRGLIAEHGISWMLPRIVGHANALDLLMSARRVRLAERDRRHQAAALRRAVPDPRRSHHRRQPRDGGGAARQRFPRGRRELHGEAAAEVYWEVGGAV